MIIMMIMTMIIFEDYHDDNVDDNDDHWNGNNDYHSGLGCLLTMTIVDHKNDDKF